MKNKKVKNEVKPQLTVITDIEAYFDAVKKQQQKQKDLSPEIEMVIAKMEVYKEADKFVCVTPSIDSYNSAYEIEIPFTELHPFRKEFIPEFFNQKEKVQFAIMNVLMSNRIAWGTKENDNLVYSAVTREHREKLFNDKELTKTEKQFAYSFLD